MCKASQRECSGILVGDRKALEWPEASMTESLLEQGSENEVANISDCRHSQVFHTHCQKALIKSSSILVYTGRRTDMVVMTMCSNNYVFHVSALIQWSVVVISNLHCFDELSKARHLDIVVI